VLAIDAAGSACGAAVASGRELLAIVNGAMIHGQAEALLPMVDEVVRQAGLAPSALDLIAVTTGPGSFTGIRVGIAAARGVALALGRPIIGITSFAAVAAALPGAAPEGRRILVALDSRRSDLFVQLFDCFGRPLSQPAARPPETLAVTFLSPRELSIAVAGDAAERAAQILAQVADAIIVETAPAVAGALRAALRQWRLGERDGAVRPLYLRPPDVSFPGGQNPRNAS
jgi:tRNA threonylcarbamoyladenosine biosynthesis protein TsaB